MQKVQDTWRIFIMINSVMVRTQDILIVKGRLDICRETRNPEWVCLEVRVKHTENPAVLQGNKNPDEFILKIVLNAPFSRNKSRKGQPACLFS